MNLRTTALRCFVTSLSLAGCFGELPADGVGSAVAAVQNVPAGVGCLRVVYRVPNATNDTTRNLGVTPGNPATLDLGYLAAGAYAFRASAYNAACGSVGAAVPTWVGDPTSATITAGYATTVPITLRPNVTTRTTVDFVQPVRAIYAGWRSNNTYAVMQDGTVRAWGANFVGTVGDGTRINATTPRVVQGLTNPTQIVGGSDFACASTPNDGLHCWGRNHGLLADGGTADSLVPARNADLEPTSLAAGEGRLCGTFGSNEVRCWGEGLPSGLDYNPGIRAASFVVGDVRNLSRDYVLWVDVDTNDLRSVQAGDPGIFGDTLRPRVVAAAVGYGHYCAVTVAGGVVCGGDNADGALGDGTTTSTSIVAPVSVDAGRATAVVGGRRYYCALRTDRTVACWGQNLVGQVGAGVDAARVTVPTAVPLADVTQVAAGANHACALITDGSVWCWGENTQGQLGDGTTTTRFSPVRVRF